MIGTPLIIAAALIFIPCRCRQQNCGQQSLGSCLQVVPMQRACHQSWKSIRKGARSRQPGGEMRSVWAQLTRCNSAGWVSAALHGHGLIMRSQRGARNSSPACKDEGELTNPLPKQGKMQKDLIFKGYKSTCTMICLQCPFALQLKIK